MSTKQIIVCFAASACPPRCRYGAYNSGSPHLCYNLNMKRSLPVSARTRPSQSVTELIRHRLLVLCDSKTRSNILDDVLKGQETDQRESTKPQSGAFTSKSMREQFGRLCAIQSFAGCPQMTCSPKTDEVRQR
jgi:hypothetical protein